MKKFLYTLLIIFLVTTANYSQDVIVLNMDDNRKALMDETPQNGMTYQVDLKVTKIEQQDFNAMVQHMNKVPFVTFTKDGDKLNFVFDTNHSFVKGWNQSNWDKWFDGMAARIRYVEENGM
jgi:hypothetical protein